MTSATLQDDGIAELLSLDFETLMVSAVGNDRGNLAPMMNTEDLHCGATTETSDMCCISARTHTGC
ncbi:hypothetical protein [Kitasatospora sp. McL0602]|uniref:hypothetical protein n=1 Tax=Kitasatospora sp. McL0602 TaxID=3439530 RepID=UPI003F8B7B3A